MIVKDAAVGARSSRTPVDHCLADFELVWHAGGRIGGDAW
jgi:hypothetical protein